MNIRIGHSTDVHRLEEGHDLYLGGIRIDHTKGLVGHSDADVLLHAIAESIIGALGLGDIGKHFPDTKPEYKGIDSKILLEKTFYLCKEQGYRINNLDSTIFAEKPILKSYIPLMRECISQILETSIGRINIKATRGEKIGFVGRQEGIAAESVVLLIK